MLELEDVDQEEIEDIPQSIVQSGPASLAPPVAGTSTETPVPARVTARKQFYNAKKRMFEDAAEVFALIYKYE